MEPDHPDLKRTRRQTAPRAVDLAKIDRLPPHSLEAEQGILGCCLLSPRDALPICIEHLQPDSFYDLRHQQIYETLAAMFEEQEAVDLITMQQRLKDKNQLEAIGGIAYLAALQDAVPSAANIEYYLEIVREKHLLRRMVQTCSNVVGRVYEHEGEVEALLDEVEQDVLKIRGERQTGGGFKLKDSVHRAIDTIEAAHENQGKPQGISTGFIDLDKLIRGLKGPDYIILAARPSIGKTSLAMNIAEHVAIDQKLPVGVFSLEMSADDLVLRMLMSRSRVRISDMHEGFLAERDFPKITTAAGRLIPAPLHIDDTAGMSISQLRAKARRMWQQHGIKLFIIDYLQLLNSTNKKVKNRQEEISDISKGIKALAKEFNVPVIVIAQLNRDLEKDKKRRKPRVSDLRESGSLEADADIIGLLYQPEKDDEDENEEQDGTYVNLFIAKQRNGPTGTVYLTFLKGYTRFESAAKFSNEEYGK